MPQSKLDDILARLQSLHNEFETELERVLEEKQAYFQYTFDRGKVRFQRQIRELQRQQKKGLVKYIIDAELKHIISVPIIYSLIVPLVLLDISITFYQHTCFRLYGISRVKRKDYLIIDRQHLAYLNSLEKLNCMYCGYGNGLMAYAREIIARTEQYWCPIKHANRALDTHRLTENFVDYGDAQAYRDKLAALRKEIRHEES